MAKVIKKGYGQIELNRCSFLRDGNIESQCVAAADLENGAIVSVDKAAKEVTAATTFTSGLLGVNYTSEKIYNQFTSGRKHFRVEKGAYPRVGYLKTGDVFSTNVMLSDGTDLSTYTTAITTGLYWTAPTTLTTAAPTSGLKLRVVEVTDTADGQTALKIQVL